MPINFKNAFFIDDAFKRRLHLISLASNLISKSSFTFFYTSLYKAYPQGDLSLNKAMSDERDDCESRVLYDI